MPIQYPSYLRAPMMADYRRTQTPQFREQDAESGPPIRERTTFDTPTTWNVTFLVERGQERLFRGFVEIDLDNGLKPFELPIRTEAGMVMQEVWFTRSGMPQLSRLDGEIFVYSAQVIARKELNPDKDDYETLKELAQISPNGQVNEGMKLLDLAINVDWPEA